MHVLQWIAVEADDVDEAYRTVGSTLDDMLNPDYQNGWFDWFVVGGGRWNVGEGDDFTEAYTEGKTNMIIHAGTDRDRFEERILLAMESRKEEFDRYAKDVQAGLLDKVISNYNPREHNYSYFSDLYPIKKVIDMAYGDWDFNSYFFDMVNQTITPQYVFEAIDNNPDVWYLVPVDFHF
jgi:hypothetical protein